MLPQPPPSSSPLAPWSHAYTTEVSTLWDSEGAMGGKNLELELFIQYYFKQYILGTGKFILRFFSTNPMGGLISNSPKPVVCWSVSPLVR